MRYESTPHARGSTLAFSVDAYVCPVYPACAGIHRSLLEACHRRRCLPRMRGDPPFVRAVSPSSALSTPHARGSTVDQLVESMLERVYPACAGIHLTWMDIAALVLGLPRMRGDPPSINDGMGKREESTPHARGSTPKGAVASGNSGVYPACAGIHRRRGS